MIFYFYFLLIFSFSIISNNLNSVKKICLDKNVIANPDISLTMCCTSSKTSHLITKVTSCYFPGLTDETFKSQSGDIMCPSHTACDPDSNSLRSTCFDHKMINENELAVVFPPRCSTWEVCVGKLQLRPAAAGYPERAARCPIRTPH